ncbi:MAG: anthranilate phosphoribosyltransferase [Candidatus Electrothrix aestuarii]|uniref:Anthranilate phosphoribosyltransferase n=1 Tax=Candidatus Electrothrix aestuarii TaxID=3062594 RepID=A0AAU8LWG2_9BACT|nr:anthranilate phosphoribosyltransferase [Candidatus Electrothrix aestuarii]
MANEKLLKDFGANIQRLINGGNLSREETYAMFCQVLGNEQPDLQQGAFLAALVSKGETIEEIAGAWQAIVEKDTVAVSLDVTEPIVENSGTGMDSLKTFNVSSAAAIVAAACGAKVARHGSRALTSFCGAVDILEAVGLDVECDPQTVVQSIQEVGIGLFNGMSPKIHPFGLGRILSQIRFGTTLNIAASLANPARPTHGLRGVYAESLLGPVAEVMASIGYHRGVVVHGQAIGQQGGMDELSVCGPTKVCEFTGNGEVKEYSLQPEDLGIRKVPFVEIAALGNLQKERRRFLTVLTGKGEKSCMDFTCLNAGATLYAGELAKSIEEGVGLASAAIADGSALAKLKTWVAVQARDGKGTARLEQELAAL